MTAPSGWVSRSTGARAAPKPSNEKQAFSSGPHIDGLDEQPSPPPDAMLPSDVVKEIEDRAGTDSLGDLQQRRRVLMQQLAPLAALYGPFGLWDARRKQMLCAIEVRVRMTATEKVTDKSADALSHADEQYGAFLDQSERSKIEFITLDTELSEITERIKSREAELYVWGREAGLAR